MNPKYAKAFQGNSKQNSKSKDDNKKEGKLVKVPNKPLINRTTSK